MIHLSHQTKGVTLYISVAENLEERKQLETLVREVEFISTAYTKTGLYIVHTLTHKEKFTVVMSLRKKESIADGDLAHVVNKIGELIFAPERSSP